MLPWLASSILIATHRPVAGLMSLPWMAALSVLVLAEKNWTHGAGLARIAGVAMVLGGVLAAL